ncbi:diguanylate cyclase [Ideonella sp. 4Y16]|uniref:ligand-binding sensor domain-containing diguanylate cyclase n=1 Tax=Ideonella alba TaxID=2824118 RepID=UPI001B39C91F|nr:ligand-binding sensor domain-containing diguanylate cyclase [Ideonella alba]MBQ0943496.1 diguanylate cyclase [Ideonella alba]
MSSHTARHRRTPRPLPAVCGLAGLGLWLALLPAAQAGTDWRAVADPIIQRIANENGLPNSLGPTAIEQDASGQLWIGTQNGLVRWDGQRMSAYRAAPGRPGALPDAFVQRLFRDRQGRLWAGTMSAGLVRFRPDSDDFEHFPAAADGLPHPSVSALADAPGQRLWVGGDGGLVRLDPPTRRVERVALVHEGATSLRITALVNARDGRLWVGTDHGLWCSDPQQRQFERVAGVPDAIVRSLFEDRSGRLWLGLRTGTRVWDPAQQRLLTVRERDGATPQPYRAETVDITQAATGDIWLASKTRGLLRVDPQTLVGQPVRHDPLQPNGLDSDAMWLVWTDRDGLLWIGSDRSLMRHDPVAARQVATLYGRTGRTGGSRGLSHDSADAVLALPDGRVWVGSPLGIEELDPVLGRVRQLRAQPGTPAQRLPEGAVYALVRHAGHVYIGSEHGLYRTTERLDRVERVAVPGRPATATVWSLHSEPGTLWIGAADGLWRLDERGTGGVVHTELTDRRVEMIAPAGDGRLWLGTRSGLALLDPATGRLGAFPSPQAQGPALKGLIVNALLTDTRGRLWLGTGGAGVYVVERPLQPDARVQVVGEDQGLQDLNIAQMLADEQGRVWVSTDDGLAWIDPDTLQAVPQRLADGVGVATYWAKSGTRAPDGTLFFGGVGGLTAIDPARWQAWRHDPAVVISELRVDGKPLPRAQWATAVRQGRLELPVGTRGLAVEFSALDYSAPELLRYGHRLDGVDGDWVSTESRHRWATYTNLSPGRHALRVRATNRNGAWSSQPLQLEVVIPAAWHQTPAFRALLGLMGLGALFALVQARTAWLRRRQAALEQLVEERTAALRDSQARLEQMAFTDALTGLANRRLFGERFDQLERLARRQGQGFALLVVDLDHFKQVNDQLGHAAGDALLVEVARRLQAQVRASDSVARMGGDEFAVLLAWPADPAQVQASCERLLAAFAEPMVHAGRPLHSSPSIGAALYPRHGRTQDELTAAADAALYEAKAGGRNTWRLASTDPVDPAPPVARSAARSARRSPVA